MSTLAALAKFISTFSASLPSDIAFSES